MALSRRTLLKGLAASGIGVVGGAAGFGYAYERHHLTLETPQLDVPALPPALDGLRVGLLTDVHHSAFVPQELIVQAVHLLLMARPDLIVLGGDYVTWGNRAFVEPCAEALSSLAAPFGVFAVLGNHDDDRDMPGALQRRGITVLKDAQTDVAIRGTLVSLLGLRFWTRRQIEVERLLRRARGMPVLLAHDPRRITEAATLGIPLVLSGHTHGGQVVIPGFGPLAGSKFPVLSGHARRGGTGLYVSRGLGTVMVPVRLNCPPEISVLTLRPAGEAEAVTASRTDAR